MSMRRSHNMNRITGTHTLVTSSAHIAASRSPIATAMNACACAGERCEQAPAGGNGWPARMPTAG